jgi:hypothetical protein
MTYLGKIDALIPLELCHKEVDHAVVEILAAQKGVPVRGFYLENTWRKNCYVFVVFYYCVLCISVTYCTVVPKKFSKHNSVKLLLVHSVADPGCLSRIPDPDFYPSWIPDLGSRIQKQQQKRGVKKNLMSYLSMKPQISQNCTFF